MRGRKEEEVSPREAQNSAERRQRIPFGAPKRKLSLDQATAERLQGKVPRWITDKDGRISAAQAGGYEFVTAEGGEKVGDSGVTESGGSHIRKLVGKHEDGSPQYAYLMAIDKEFYDEDQRAKEAVNAKVDESVRRGTGEMAAANAELHGRGGTYLKDVQYQP